MRYSTRKEVHVDRCASAWLIKRFIDPDAEFLFATHEEAMPRAQREGAIPFVDEQQIRAMLEPESGYVAGTREQEPFPG